MRQHCSQWKRPWRSPEGSPWRAARGLAGGIARGPLGANLHIKTVAGGSPGGCRQITATHKATWQKFVATLREPPATFSVWGLLPGTPSYSRIQAACGQVVAASRRPLGALSLNIHTHLYIHSEHTCMNSDTYLL